MNVQLVRDTNDHVGMPSVTMKIRRATVPDNVSPLEFTCPPRMESPAVVPVDTEATERINRSISYMEEHLDQPTKVSSLASMIHVSPSYFHSLFKRCTGFAPIDYFTRLRMERARKLLDTTSQSVKEVAAALGYNDPFYFSRVFKAVNRVAPSHYRAQNLIQISTSRENRP